MNARAGYRVPLLATLGLLLFSAIPSAASTPDPHFPRYRELEPNVAFWRDVFTRYTSRNVVFHDPEMLDIVWEVHDVTHILDGPGSDISKSRDLKAYTARQTRYLAEKLRSLDPARPRDDVDKRLAAALRVRGANLPSLGVLADRVRAQRGLGDRLCESYRRAVSYLPLMRPLMAKHRVPEDLVYLPLVESGYNVGAYSHKGAAGIYQFTRSTGRRYLHIDHAVDERRDPLLATEAAARYLRANFDRLGTWPLAITAYNHGEHGIEYAVQKLGTRELSEIIARYESRSFGFASKNFYAEFLAARESMDIAARRCSVEGVIPLQRDSLRVEAPVYLSRLAATGGIGKEQILAMNPALTPEVARGRLPIPKGYTLYFPPGARDRYAQALKTAPRATTVASRASSGGVYTVRRGDTLSEIASAHGTTVGTLMRMNSIKNARLVRVGQRLRVPGSSSRSAASAQATPIDGRDASASLSVRVRSGETLSHIARRHGVSVAALQQHNGIKNPTSIRAGQALEIPGASPSTVATHRVARGQTLSEIAVKYRTTVGAIKDRNGIRDATKIRQGQVLEIPR